MYGECDFDEYRNQITIPLYPLILYFMQTQVTQVTSRQFAMWEVTDVQVLTSLTRRQVGDPSICRYRLTVNV